MWTNYTQEPHTSQKLWPLFSPASATREKTPQVQPASKKTATKRCELSRCHSHNRHSIGLPSSQPHSPPELTEPPHVLGCSLSALRQPVSPQEMDVTVTTKVQASNKKRVALVQFGQRRGGSSREGLRELCQATWGRREPQLQQEKKGQLLSSGRLHPVFSSPAINTKPKFVIDGEAVPGTLAGSWDTGDGQEEQVELMYSLSASLPSPETSLVGENEAAEESETSGYRHRLISPNASVRINRDYIRVLNNMHRVDVLLSSKSNSSTRNGQILATAKQSHNRSKKKQLINTFKPLPPWSSKVPSLILLSQPTNGRLKRHPV